MQTLEGDLAETFLGTRGYIAPEMLQRVRYSKAIDVWALGIIVFVLLCGCLPFDDDIQEMHNPALLKQRFQLRFPRWAKDLSDSAKDLLSHLLDIDPRSRYTAEQALRHPWVRGDTAHKASMLASPGRMTPASMRRKRATPSPHSRSGASTPSPPKGGAFVGTAAPPPPPANLIAPPGMRNNGMVRKVSL